jgi:glycosyltransferase involved in cell wall biosynthesis
MIAARNKMNDNERNVLFISYDGMTDALGQSQVIPYLIGLTKKGFNFTVLSCEKKERYEQNAKDISTLFNDAGINWQPIQYTKNPPVFSTLYDYWKLIQKAKAIHRESPLSLIHCRSYIPALAGQYMKRKYSIPFLFDMRGFWADERIDGGLWSLKNQLFKTIYQFFKRKEIEFLAEATAIISLTTAAKNEMLKWQVPGVNPEKITVIPCCVDTRLFNGVNVSGDEQQQLRQHLSIKKTDFVLGYLGSIGTWYLLDEMLQYFAQLIKKMPDARFLFITQENHEHIRTKANEYGINADAIVIAKAARKEVPAMVSLFNYGIFFIKPSYSKIASSPVKQGEIMAMGVPVVCNARVGDTGNIVNKYHSGLVVDNFEFDKSIQQIVENKQFDKEAIRAGAIDFFSLEKGVESYYEVYFKTLNTAATAK